MGSLRVKTKRKKATRKLHKHAKEITKSAATSTATQLMTAAMMAGVLWLFDKAKNKTMSGMGDGTPVAGDYGYTVPPCSIADRAIADIACTFDPDSDDCHACDNR